MKGNLTLKERIEIEIQYRINNLSITQIAEKLKRNKSTISREINGKSQRKIKNRLES